MGRSPIHLSNKLYFNSHFTELLNSNKASSWLKKHSFYTRRHTFGVYVSSHWFSLNRMCQHTTVLCTFKDFHTVEGWWSNDSMISWRFTLFQNRILCPLTSPNSKVGIYLRKLIFLSDWWNFRLTVQQSFRRTACGGRDRFHTVLTIIRFDRMKLFIFHYSVSGQFW